MEKTKDESWHPLVEGDESRHDPLDRVAALVRAEQAVTTTRIGGVEGFSLTLNATLSGASAFIMRDGNLRGDKEALRSLLLRQRGGDE